jgi:hypothetical protein
VKKNYEIGQEKFLSPTKFYLGTIFVGQKSLDKKASIVYAYLGTFQ